MSQFIVNPQRFDPYRNFFKFQVRWDNRFVAGISKVSALKRSTKVVEHREGGDPSTSAKCRVAPRYEPITLERGLTHDFESRPLGRTRSGTYRRRSRHGVLPRRLP
jgi:phage tail-like protein